MTPHDQPDFVSVSREPWYRRWFAGLFAPPMRPDYFPDLQSSAQPIGPPAPPPPVEVHKQYDLRLHSPALGDAFDFTVLLRCAWHATGADTDVESLLQQIDARHQRLIPEIEGAVRNITRQRSMTECASAEQDLNAQLTNRWRFHDEAANAPEFTCTVRAQVSPDSDLRDLQRDAWILDAESSNRQRATRRDIDQLSERIKLWQALIDQVQNERTSGAVQLALRPDDQETVLIGPTGHPAAGPTSRESLDRTLERERELFRLAHIAYDVHRQNGTEEAVWRGDYALRDLLTYLGIPGGADEPNPEPVTPSPDSDDVNTPA